MAKCKTPNKIAVCTCSASDIDGQECHCACPCYCHNEWGMPCPQHPEGELI